MTFEKLKELIEKYNIPKDVKLLSDSEWEVDENKMNGVFYNSKENHIIFTHEFKYSYYLADEDYIRLD